MIHDILLTLLSPDGDTTPLKEFLNSDIATDFLHPCEFGILEDILKIADQQKEIKKFILQYRTQSSKHVIGANLGQTPSSQNQNSLEGCNDDTLQKGLYIQSFSDGINLALAPWRQNIVKMEQTYLKTPSLSLIFVYQQITEFSALFSFLLRLICGIKTQRLHGCAILQYLQQHSLHGNSDIMKAIQIIQRSVHVVFLKQLSQWLIYGKFIDVYGEFFIQHIEPKRGGTLNSTTSEKTPQNTTGTISDATSVNTDLWRYEIAYEMLPQYFTLTWAEKVLFIGQTVVMFNSDAQNVASKTDNLWMQDELLCGGSVEKGPLWNNEEHIYFNKIQHLYDEPSLNVRRYEEVIDDIKNFVSKRLSEIAINQADLIRQLKLIKDFYLMGRGDFYIEFFKLANGILKINRFEEITARDVTKSFQTAASNINVTDDLEQFSICINPMDELNLSSDYDNRGFIQFMKLKYKVKWPLHLLFSPKVIDRYNNMFRFFLQIKNIQFDLQMIWTADRERKTSKHSPLLQLRNKLMFLVDNLQYYLQVDVLESQFSILMETIRTSHDFEHIQRAHTIFQANILSLCFLLNNSNPNQSFYGGQQMMTASLLQQQHTIESPVLTIINKIMLCIGNFCVLCANCGSADQLTQIEQEQYESCESLIADYVNDLMRLLIGLKDGPSSAPLTQLLLRLDFNYWFSTKNS